MVELLIALALVGTILLMLFSALRLASKSWESIEASHESSADLRVSRHFIQRSLRQVRPLKDAQIEGIPLRPLSGDADAIEWVASLSDHLGMGGLYLLRLHAEDRGDHSQLVLYRWLLHPDVLGGGDDWPAWEPLVEGGVRSILSLPVPARGDSSDADIGGGAFGRTVLIPELREFRIAYFGRVEGRSEKEWSETWADRSELPDAVAISLTTVDEAWAPLIIPLPGA